MAQQRAGTAGSGTTELRLALVCYGGVSLAIYMHGVAKELHQLVRASRRFDALGPDGENPFDAGTQTEHAYFEALRDLARDGRPLTVSIDVVAGTSAGGINGVCLAKVLARNGSQDALKRLWIDEGDLKKLLNALPLGGWRTRAALAVARLLRRGLGAPVSPLRGDRMSRLLHDAIAQMDAPADPTASTLVLPTTPLELFVTTTDLAGSAALVASGAGGVSQRETEHAQVLTFGSAGQPGGGDLGPDAVGGLAFAARATSSFPGAFPPVSVASFADELEGRPLDRAAVVRRFRRRSAAGEGGDEHAWYVDGGVLDNAPFDLAVEAIGRKRAQTEVVRRLLYIQPDPGAALHESPRPAAVRPPYGYLRGTLQAVVSVRGTHSILRELEALRDLNQRIATIGAITRLQAGTVQAELARAWAQVGARSAADPWSSTDPDDVRRLADQIYADAPAFVGAGYGGYCRLKVDVAGRRLADEVVARFVYPPGSGRTSFVRAAVAAWARQRPEWLDPDPGPLLALLAPVDVPYRERRLMFILAGINELYPRAGDPGAPRREDLDAMKHRAWELLDQLHEAPAQAVGGVPAETVAFLGEALTDADVLGDVDAFATAHDQDFERLFLGYRDALAQILGDGSGPIWQGFVQHTAGWSEDDRRALVSRYLGFPLWDALIFPTVALSALPQFTPITVGQISPLAARALPTPPDGKLRGVTLHHFGGFVDAAWRENDYLWGRLDAAELLLRTLRGGGTTQAGEPTTAEEAAQEAGPRLWPALRAVLAAEQDLTRVADVVARLRATVPQLSGSGAAG